MVTEFEYKEDNSFLKATKYSDNYTQNLFLEMGTRDVVLFGAQNRITDRKGNSKVEKTLMAMKTEEMIVFLERALDFLKDRKDETVYPYM